MATSKGMYGLGFAAALMAFVTIYSGFSGDSIIDILTLKSSSGGTHDPGGSPDFSATVDPTAGPGGGATGDLAAMEAWCDSVAGKYPYAWGGGHVKIGQPSPGTNHESGGPIVTGFDCSGAVSGALHAAGLLKLPLTSGGLMLWGEKGVGSEVTVYASPTHTFMNIRGQWFGTGRLGERGGVDWGNHDDTTNYIARRPKHTLTGNSPADKSVKDSIR